MGPLISEGPVSRRSRASFSTTRQVAFQGQCPEGPGYWFPPTVLAPVSSTDRAFQEEIFGPVVVVTPFDDEADAVRLANDSEYGLSGSIWTRDIGKAIRVSRGIETGALSVNSNSLRPLLDALRRLQALRPRSRARAGCGGCLHRDEERLHQHGRLTPTTSPTGPSERNH